MEAETVLVNKKVSDTRKVWFFFILTFAISWVIWIPVILFLQEGANLHPLILVGGYGPFLSAIIVTWKVEGRASLRNWDVQVAHQHRLVSTGGIPPPPRDGGVSIRLISTVRWTSGFLERVSLVRISGVVPGVVGARRPFVRRQ